MTSIPTRNSVLAITVETTEGTPVKPTAATQYIALQPDVDLSFSVDTLENEEFKNSLAPGESIPGGENPTASFSHYLRHSGVEGTAPAFKEVLKAAFGAEVVAGSEFLTTSGSTVSAIESTGASTNFQRGQGMLIKDGINGYRLRAVHSVSGTTITPSFNLANAPASGIGLGKAVLYKPANTGHQTLDLWHYIGNDGAIQMQAGVRPTEITFPFVANELINMGMSFEGLSGYFDPIVIAATDTKLDFTDADGTFAATITAKTYKDPHDLATAITDAMNTANAGETHTVTYSDSTGKFTITSTGGTLSLLWNTGGNAANTIGDALGFSTAADDTGSTSYTSDNAQSWASPQTPTFDSNTAPLVAKNMEVMMGDQDEYACIHASEVTATLTLGIRKGPDLCAESGFGSSIYNLRNVEVSIKTELQKHDVKFFKKFRLNTTTRFQVSFGPKSGGNWLAGRSGVLYLPTGKIYDPKVSEDEGIASFECVLRTFADSSGNGEAYLNFL